MELHPDRETRPAGFLNIGDSADLPRPRGSDPGAPDAAVMTRVERRSSHRVAGGGPLPTGGRYDGRARSTGSTGPGGWRSESSWAGYPVARNNSNCARLYSATVVKYSSKAIFMS